MMGHRTPLNGEEIDAISRFRHVVCYVQRAGVRRKIKRQVLKRERKLAKADARSRAEE